MATPTFDASDAKHFRQVLGHFPTGVTVVTAMADGRPLGFTIGSFTSVSLDPPLVGFLPQVDSDTWAAMEGNGKFCVNVLRDHQADLCWRFAKKGLDDGRFDEFGWSLSPNGSPMLDGVGAWLDCDVEQVERFGDHYFVVGRVVDLSHDPDPHVPLLFYRGAHGGFLASQ